MCLPQLSCALFSEQFPCSGAFHMSARVAVCLRREVEEACNATGAKKQVVHAEIREQTLCIHYKPKLR